MTAIEDISQEYLLPIGEEWIQTEKTDTIRLPYDGSPVSKVPHGDPALVHHQAAHAARKAAGELESWSNLERAELLDRIATLLRRDHAAFASVISLETGKPISDDVRDLAPGLYVRQGNTETREIANCAWVVFKDFLFVANKNFPWGARDTIPLIRKQQTNRFGTF